MSGGTAGFENQIIDCDFRDSVASQLLLSGVYERYNCRANAAADLSASQDAPGRLFGFAQKTSSQTITATTLTTVQFNTVPTDTYGAWDSTNYRWISLPNGRYRFRATVGFTASGSTATDARIYVGLNGSTAVGNSVRLDIPTVSVNKVFTLVNETILNITALTNYVSTIVYTEAQNMTIGVDAVCTFEMERLGD